MSQTTQRAVKVGSVVVVIAVVVGIRLISDRNAVPQGGSRESASSGRRATPGQWSSSISWTGSTFTPGPRPPQTKAMKAREAQIMATYLKTHRYADQVKFTYQALVERSASPDGKTVVPQRSLILVDRKKYCVKEERIRAPVIRLDRSGHPVTAPASQTEERTSNNQPIYSTWSVYNGDEPEIEWDYTPSEKSLGIPMPANSTSQRMWSEARCNMQSSSALHLVALAVKRDGFDAVAKRYGIPDDYRGSFSSDAPQYTTRVRGLTTIAWTLGEAIHSAHPAGAEIVAGYPCAVYELRRVYPEYRGTVHPSQSWQDGHVTEETHSTYRAGFAVLTRISVEKRTGLVLKQKTKVIRGDAPGALQFGDFEVKELKFVDSLPADLFEIPAGTNVQVSALMLDVGVKLPKDVIQTPALTVNGLPSSGLSFGPPIRWSGLGTHQRVDRSRHAGAPPS